MTKLFTPSSTDLLDMVRSAEAKFDADRKQAAPLSFSEISLILKALHQYGDGRSPDSDVSAECTDLRKKLLDSCTPLQRRVLTGSK
jgi:hypothetical protein